MVIPTGLYSTTGAGCGPIHGRGRGSDHIKVAYPVTTLTLDASEQEVDDLDNPCNQRCGIVLRRCFKEVANRLRCAFHEVN